MSELEEDVACGSRAAHMLSTRFGYGRPFSSARCFAASFCDDDKGWLR